MADVAVSVKDLCIDYRNLAAAANGVSFVPILPGREAESWRRLQEEALPKLLHGTFSHSYQNELLAALRSALHG